MYPSRYEVIIIDDDDDIRQGLSSEAMSSSPVGPIPGKYERAPPCPLRGQCPGDIYNSSTHFSPVNHTTIAQVTCNLCGQENQHFSIFFGQWCDYCIVEYAKMLLHRGSLPWSFIDYELSQLAVLPPPSTGEDGFDLAMLKATIAWHDKYRLDFDLFVRQGRYHPSPLTLAEMEQVRQYKIHVKKMIRQHFEAVQLEFNMNPWMVNTCQRTTPCVE